MIVLLDIDGTLIRTGRAGSRAMNRAFEDVFGIAGAFDGVEMAGRTDRWILDDAASRAGVDLSGDNFQRFRDRYFSRLTDTLREPAPGKGVLPGVRRLLETLDTRDDVFAALLTGNCEEGARIKLQHFDIWKFFRCGAYGDEVTDRNHLFEIAMRARGGVRRTARAAERCRRCRRHRARCGVREGRRRALGRGRDRSVRYGHAAQERRRCRGEGFERYRGILSNARRTDLKYDDVVGEYADEADLIPAPSGAGRKALTFYETNVSGARSLLRFLRSELDALTFAKQLEDGAANRAAMKEVFDSTFIADKPEPLVDQKPCDRAGRHTRVLRMFPAV